ncbi:MAG: ankyrin repeat domain-containing protein [Gammaproteobacteria bacterium]|nr:ankyrin repeat domain-containing protein [Gammaproteobacteria bacterium]
MKKNGVTKEIITEDTSLVLNKSDDDDEDEVTTTEEASEDDEDAKTIHYFNLIYTETLRKTFNQKYNSIAELISKLKAHKDTRLNKLINHLVEEEITGNISLRALSKILMRFILKLISPMKIKPNIDKDRAHLKQRDFLRFYLKLFKFTPNSTIVEKSSKKFGYNIIMMACENCENPYLLDLLVKELKGDINETSRDETRCTPLYISCEAGNLDAVKLLTSFGAEVNLGRCTALGSALSEKHHEIVQFLLSLPELAPTQLSDGISPFLLAAQYATAQNFLTLMTRKGVDPNIITVNNESALTLALLRGYKGLADKERDNIVRILLNSSCFTVDCNLVTNGETALFIASRMGNLFAVNKLVDEGAKCNFVATRGHYKGHSVLSIAVYEGYLEIVERLIDVCELDFIKPIVAANLTDQYTLLNLAFASQKSRKENKNTHERIYLLLQKHWTKTHPEQVRTHINKLIKDEKLNELRRWKEFILSTSSLIPDTENTPLHTASANGKTKSINFLITDIHVPVDPQNKKGDTPLHVACRKKQSGAVSQLLTIGADPKKQNNDKENPFTIAKLLKSEACVRAFVEYSFNMGHQLPSAESARADNDELLAKIIDEFLPPAPEKPSENPVVEDFPQKTKKKRKKKKNRNKRELIEAATNQEHTDVKNLTYLEHNTPQDDAVVVVELESNEIQDPHNINEVEITLPLLSHEMNDPKIDSQRNSTEGHTTPPLPAEDSPKATHQDIETQNNSAEGDSTLELSAEIMAPEIEGQEEPAPEQIIPIESELNDIVDEENSSYSKQSTSQELSPKEIQSPSPQPEDEDGHSIPEDKSQEETENESKEDQSEEDFLAVSREDESEEETNNLPAEDPSLEKVAILPSPPPSPLRSRSFFSHTIRPTPNVDFNAKLFSELKDAIENEFRYILSDPAHVFVKASLQNLIDYYQRLKYFAIIEKISEDSPVLSFIRELRDHTLLYGLDINRNVKHWQSKAIKLFQTMLDRDGIFQLDYVQTNEFSAGY